ncbi:MAG: aminotransferase class V-fold PLP-dependent enzyme [Alphaproteobacteria bacterium]|nr:aminotransferase class V-fold PLP-dependent enzyme [Alphaproteobacteria bacterium]
MTSPALDVAFVRRQFPQLADGMAFFENAGGSLVPEAVKKRLLDFVEKSFAQPSYDSEPSLVSRRRMADGKRLAADLLGVEPEEIVLGPSTTLNFYVLAQALRHLFQPGDEIIVTNQDHEANVGAWRQLDEFGLVLREWQIDKTTGELRLADLDRLLSPKTKLVCVTHCSNVVGSVNDMAAIAARAKKVGALTVADGVGYAPHHLINVRALGVDAYACSAYKIFGTHIGILWVKPELAAKAKTQNHYFIKSAPATLNPGGLTYELVAGLGGTGDYLDLLYRHHFGSGENSARARYARVFKLIEAHEAKLGKRIVDFLKSRKSVRLIGEDGARAPIICFTVAGKTSTEVAKALFARRIAVGHGDFYAKRCVEALGLEGVIRISFAHYNDDAEVDRLIEALKEILPV